MEERTDERTKMLGDRIMVTRRMRIVCAWMDAYVMEGKTIVNPEYESWRNAMEKDSTSCRRQNYYAIPPAMMMRGPDIESWFVVIMFDGWKEPVRVPCDDRKNAKNILDGILEWSRDTERMILEAQTRRYEGKDENRIDSTKAQPSFYHS